MSLTVYQICALSCGCRTRTLASATPFEPFSGTFKVKCVAHARYSTPGEMQRGCLPCLPDGTVYAECPVDFGWERCEPED